MGKATREGQEVMEENKRRFERARKSVKEMEEAVAPYTEPREIRQRPEPSRWRDAADFERSHFMHDLEKASHRLPDDPSQPDEETRRAVRKASETSIG
jgi:hypothetical protein